MKRETKVYFKTFFSQHLLKVANLLNKNLHHDDIYVS